MKMCTQRQAELKDILLTGADFMSVAGDIKRLRFISEDNYAG